MFLSSCGGGNSGTTGTPTSTAPPSKLTNRVFLTNQYNGVVDIVNAKLDQFFGFPTVSVGSGPSLMQITSDKQLALVFDTGSNIIEGVNIPTEAATGSIQLPNWTESFVIGTDNKTVYIAVRNATTTLSVPGALEIADTTVAQITHTIPIPKAHWVVLSPDNKKVLVFSDDSDSVSLVDTTSFAVTTIPGFDRPVWGVFSTDSSKAYIMNCGPECGGTTARVTPLDIASATPGAFVVVSGATYGLLDGSNLYVAGTGAGGGKLDIVNTSSLSVSKSGIPITDGYHWRMLLSNGQLFVGARSCSNTANGCLAIVKTADGTSTLAAAPGDVTGLEPIPNRPVVYVVQGGELVIYNTTTNQPQSTQIDIVGKAFDVRYVDAK